MIQTTPITVVAVIAGLLVATAQGQTLEIAAEAPVGVPDDWCATGRMQPEDYRNAWERWRTVAHAAEARDDAPCYGFALTRLALLAENQDFSQEAAPYWEHARAVLETKLPPTDPRLARLDLELAGVARARGERERALDLWTRASGALRAASSARELPEPLTCPPVLQEERGRAEWLMGRSLIGDAKGLERLLERAEFGTLDALLSVSAWDEALEVADRLEVLLESRAAATDAPGTERSLAFDASRLVELLERHPSARADSARASRLSHLAARAGPLGDLAHVKSLEALADTHLANDRPEEAERVLREALDARDTRLRLTPTSRIGGQGDAVRSGVVRRLAKILQDQERWADQEALLREAVGADQEAGDPSWALQSLAYFYGDHSRWEEQEAVLRRLAARQERPTSSLHRQLARCLRMQGRLLEAEGEALRSYEALVEAVEPTNTNLAEALELLGRIRSGLGQDEAAAENFASGVEVYEALERQKRGAGEELQWFLQMSLARMRRLARQLEGAEAALIAAEEGLENEEAPRPSSRARLAASWAALRRSQGSDREADEWSRRAESWCDRIEPPRERDRCRKFLGPDWV